VQEKGRVIRDSALFVKLNNILCTGHLGQKWQLLLSMKGIERLKNLALRIESYNRTVRWLDEDSGK
jgi:hypothetical protein